VLWFHESSTPEWPEIFALKARRAPSSPPWLMEDEEAVARLVVVVESTNSNSWRRPHLLLKSSMAAEGFEPEQRYRIY
jgi:hypothetical protein